MMSPPCAMCSRPVTPDEPGIELRADGPNLATGSVAAVHNTVCRKMWMQVYRPHKWVIIRRISE